ncbi:hypothetical protein [Magnetococcus sp. PR-3]|uniref:hypothetical protein n=1 Tax=Magnetococcus sp. PR-3 TaxID=3120355 RepID=UPI002FCDEBD2
MKKLDHIGLAEPMIHGLNFIRPGFTVGYNTTYAPSMYVLTASFMDPATNTYQEVKQEARLVSVAFSMIAMVLLLWVVRLLYGAAKWLSPALMATALFSLPLLFINYSKGISSHITSPFVATTCILILFSFLRSGAYSYKRVTTFALLVGILFSFNYQTIYFLPPLSLILLWNSHVALRRPLKKSFADIALFTLIFIPFFITIYLIFLSSKTNAGMSWNVGTNHEFLFPLPPYGGTLESFLIPLKFLVTMTWQVIQDLTAFVPSNDLLYPLVPLLVIPLVGVGLVSLLVSKNRESRYFGWFTVLFALTVFSLHLLRLAPISPTRHGLVFLPFIALLFVAGFVAVSRVLERIWKEQFNPVWTASILVVLMAGAALSHHPNLMQQGNDQLDPEILIPTLEKHDVATVLQLNLTINANFMPELSDQYRIYATRAFTNKLTHLTELKTDGKPIALLSQSYAIHEDIIQSIKQMNGYVEYESFEISSRFTPENSPLIIPHHLKNGRYMVILGPKL